MSATASQVGAYIREQRSAAGVSLRQLARTAGVSNPYLSQVERGLRKPSVGVLAAIARGLKISAEWLYEQAGILDRRTETHHAFAATARIPRCRSGTKRCCSSCARPMSVSTPPAAPTNFPTLATFPPPRRSRHECHPDREAVR
jgi:DNA-binding XRE family transcriptional regulator